jgi:hypothetical protein
MPSFRDAQKREWTVNITVRDITRIRQDNDGDPRFMLGENSVEEAMLRLRQDPVLLCRVLYLLCETQREKQGVDEEAFYMEVLNSGDAIADAIEALGNAILFFSPQWKRDLTKAAADKTTSIQNQAVTKAMAKINDPALEERMLAALDKQMEDALTFSMNAAGSPASPA